MRTELCKTCYYWDYLNSTYVFSKLVLRSKRNCIGYKYRPHSGSDGYFNCKFWKNVMREKRFVPYLIRLENIDLTVLDTYIRNVSTNTPLCIRCENKVKGG